jgi:hypothetical protein
MLQDTGSESWSLSGGVLSDGEARMLSLSRPEEYEILYMGWIFGLSVAFLLSAF